MLAGSAAWLESNGVGPSGEKTVLENAVLESFLVHARNLVDFLQGQSNRNDTIKRSEFALGKRWSPVRGSLPKDLIRQASKHMAHLTWDRIPLDQEQPWWHMEIAQQVLDVLDHWATMLHEGRPELDDPVDGLRARLSKASAMLAGAPRISGVTTTNSTLVFETRPFPQ